jgi:uncharacterized membrane protein (TIGR02234 family)
VTVASRRLASRLKYGAILLAVLASGLVLTASTQTWFTLHLTAASGHAGTLTVVGSDAAPAIAALSLAGVAFGGALALAGRVLRYVLALLGLVLAAGVIGSTASAMADPVGTGITVVSKATGIAGDSSVRSIVAHADASAWPALALAGGIALAVVALGVAATGHLWPVASRRYGTTEQASAREDATPRDADRPEDDPESAAVTTPPTTTARPTTAPTRTTPTGAAAGRSPELRSPRSRWRERARRGDRLDATLPPEPKESHER